MKLLPSVLVQFFLSLKLSHSWYNNGLPVNTFNSPSRKKYAFCFIMVKPRSFDRTTDDREERKGREGLPFWTLCQYPVDTFGWALAWLLLASQGQVTQTVNCYWWMEQVDDGILATLNSLTILQSDPVGWMFNGRVDRRSEFYAW